MFLYAIAPYYNKSIYHDFILVTSIISRSYSFLFPVCLIIMLLYDAVFQSNPYALKEGSGEMSAWTSAGLQPSGGYYPYDPTLAAYG